VRIVLHAEEVAEEFCDFILKVENVQMFAEAIINLHKLNISFCCLKKTAVG
jgi:hypothetical protein